MKPQWQAIAPTENGWYWFRDDGAHRIPTVVLRKDRGFYYSQLDQYPIPAREMLTRDGEFWSERVKSPEESENSTF